MLAAMFSGRHELQREPDGSFFIDRDGAHFRHILNFLRDGQVDTETLPRDQVRATKLSKLRGSKTLGCSNGFKSPQPLLQISEKFTDPPSKLCAVRLFLFLCAKFVKV